MLVVLREAASVAVELAVESRQLMVKLLAVKLEQEVCHVVVELAS